MNKNRIKNRINTLLTAYRKVDIQSNEAAVLAIAIANQLINLKKIDGNVWSR